MASSRSRDMMGTMWIGRCESHLGEVATSARRQFSVGQRQA